MVSCGARLHGLGPVTTLEACRAQTNSACCCAARIAFVGQFLGKQISVTIWSDMDAGMPGSHARSSISRPRKVAARALECMSSGARRGHILGLVGLL